MQASSYVLLYRCEQLAPTHLPHDERGEYDLTFGEKRGSKRDAGDRMGRIEPAVVGTWNWHCLTQLSLIRYVSKARRGM